MTTKPTSHSRILGFDYLRSLCAIVVVAIHSLDTNPITQQLTIDYLRFPVPIFLIISFFLLFNRTEILTQSLPQVGWKRFQRMAPQYFSWTVIYLIFRSFGGNQPLEFSWQALSSYGLMGSSAMQLYYVPLLMYFTLLLLPVIRTIRTHLKRNLIVLPLLMALSIIPFYLYLTHYLPLSQHLFTYYLAYNLPYAVLGLCIAHLVNQQKDTSPYLLVFLFLIFTGMFTTAVWLTGNPALAFYYFRLITIVAVLFVISYYASVPEHSLVSWISKLSFGIYLCHALFTEGFQHFETKMGLNLASLELTIANFVMSSVAAIGLSYVLFQFKRTRFLVI